MTNKKYFLILVFLYHISAFGQEKVVIKGRMMNTVTSNVYVSTYTDYLSYSNLILDSCKLSKNGTFSLEFEWAQPGPAKFFHGKEYTQLYLLPGDNYELELDVSRFDSSVVHTTNGANLNAYYAQKYIRFSPRGINRIYAPSALDFLRIEDSIFNSQLAFLDAFYAGLETQNEHTKAFYNYEFAQLYFYVAKLKLEYANGHAFFNKLSEPPVLPDTFFGFLERQVAPIDDYYSANSYLSYRQSLIDFKYKQAYKLDTLLVFFDYKLNEILSHTEGVVKAYLLAKWTLELLRYSKDQQKALVVFDAFLKHAHNEEYKKILEQEFQTQLILAKGKDAPSFTLLDLNGKEVSLHDFKGKVVYLDFWASWCAPCIAEVPHAKLLRETLKDKNIVFLYVSLDSQEEHWKTAVAKHQMEGVHVFLPGNFDSETAKKYHVKGIPHYVIIDKEGKIIDNKAQRPSGNVVNELELLLD